MGQANTFFLAPLEFAIVLTWASSNYEEVLATLKDDVAASYPQLLQLMVTLINGQAQEQVPAGEAWRDDAQTLAIKLFRHIATMQDLAGGSSVSFADGSTFDHIDFASIFVVARAALETYLVWHYIYGGDDAELNRFRHLTWRLGGLMDRLALIPVTNHGKEVQARTQSEVNELVPELTAHAQMQTFTPKQQKRLLEGDWKIAMGTATMAAAAGLHSGYFENAYSHLCGFSHASYISALQVGQARELDVQRSLAQPFLATALMIMGHFAFSYTKQFPKTSEILDRNVEAKRLAQRWAMGPKDWDPIFGGQ